MTAAAHADRAGLPKPAASAPGVLTLAMLGSASPRTRPDIPSAQAMAVRPPGAPSSRPVAKPAEGVAAQSPRTNTEDFRTQLDRGLSAAIAARNGSVTLRLSPEALGDMTIRVGLDGSALSARFEVATDTAHRLLGDSLGTLRTHLEGKGLNVEQLHIEFTPTPTPPPEASNVGPSTPGHSPALPNWSSGGSQDSGATPDGRGGTGGDPRDTRSGPYRPPALAGPTSEGGAPSDAGRVTSGYSFGLDAIA